MPKVTIDYSNTIIYKIFCKNPEIKDLYIGHTTNFVQRKHAHKNDCINVNSICHNMKVYKVIRDNGGWDSWTMEIVNFFNCKNIYEAREKEQEYFVLLNATLNSVEPLPPPKPVKNKKRVFYCGKCNIIFPTEKILDAHNNTKKHKMDINLNLQLINPQKCPNYVCEICDYFTSNRKDFNKHIKTKKHIYNINKKNIKSDITIFECICGKKYNYRGSIFNHKKNCKVLKEHENKNYNGDNKEAASLSDDMDMGENIIIDESIKITKEMFLKLINDNQEMIKIIKEQQQQINLIIPKISNIGPTTTTNNTTMNNTNNNNFNLNFFLNEKCKDALNMSEFIESLKITLEDLQYSRSNGLVQGISNVMIRGLKELDIYKRPIHCTDVKRDTMYIKDKEKWEKDEKHEKMKNTIIKIANKERNAISAWVDINPDWFDTETKQMEYLTLINKVCEPIENDIKNEKKIIKNIGKEIVLNKETEKLLMLK